MSSATYKKKKKIVMIIVVYLLFFTFSQSNNYNSSIQATLLNEFTDISVSDAYNMTEIIVSLYILDVRTEEEYSIGHIKNSYLLPYTEIKLRQDELPENKSQPILVYCRSGRRSAIASATLFGLNFTEVLNMLGGFSAWLDANYPYEASVVGPTLDLTAIILVISIISTLGLAIIIFVGIYFIGKNQKTED